MLLPVITSRRVDSFIFKTNKLSSGDQYNSDKTKYSYTTAIFNNILTCPANLKIHI